jgi:carboxymethylenebutenolidase
MARGTTTAPVLAFVAGLAAGVAGTSLLQAPGRSGAPVANTHGEWVAFRNAAGQTIRAYVAYPERNAPGPGVLVIHEIFGLTDWEPTVADRLAANGFVALAPDLLSSRFGRTPASPDSGRKLTALLEPDGVTADLDAAYDYLNRLGAVRKDAIGTIGFCWGGGQSFRYATHNPRLQAAVICYGPAPDSTLLPGIRARLLGVYGEDDARINADLPTVSRWLQGLGKSFPYDIYPGTGHGFLKPGRKGSGTDQVEKAWQRILTFYRETLGP